MQNFLNCSSEQENFGRRYTIYTTLEPCAMCTGMMLLTNVDRTVYGQKDEGYGKALERLHFDTSHLKDGYKRYPVPLISSESKSKFAKELHRQYKSKIWDRGITGFLRSKKARRVFEDARSKFKSKEFD